MATAMLAMAEGAPGEWRGRRGRGQVVIGGVGCAVIWRCNSWGGLQLAGVFCCFTVWVRRAFQKTSKRDHRALIGQRSGTPGFHEALFLSAPMTPRRA
jgi:hypothetical protein